jgi:hypothetical protein
MENDENQNLIDDHEEATTGMDEVDNFDFERAMAMMGVMEKCVSVAPRCTAIFGLAQAALNEMNEEAKDIAQRRAKAVKDLERKRDEALATQAKQREAEEAAEVEKTEAARQAAAQKAAEAHDPKPPKQSETDKVAINNMRRA